MPADAGERFPNNNDHVINVVIHLDICLQFVANGDNARNSEESDPRYSAFVRRFRGPATGVTGIDVIARAESTGLKD